MEQEKKQETKETQTNDVIATIRQEYENKIAEINKKHQEELEQQKKQLNDEHIATIHALFSKTELEKQPVKVEEQDEEKDFLELAQESLNKKLKL